MFCFRDYVLKPDKQEFLVLLNNINITNSINVSFKGNSTKSFPIDCPDIKMKTILQNSHRMDIFNTEKGKDFWAMNLAAIYYANHPITMPSKIECEEDRQILSSKNPEDCAKWTHWINPKNGKTYIVINKKNNEDGTRTVRVLDADGKFIKETNIVPKKIIQVDTFSGTHNIDYGGNIGFHHGEIVRKHIERNNPIADIETVNITDFSTKEISDEAYIMTLEDILQRISNGEKIDVINCSFGADFKPDTDTDEDAMHSSSAITDIINKKFSTDSSNKIIQLLEQITKTGTRVVFAAGNEGKDYISLEFGAKGIDVVGAINDNGSVCDFSSARNFAFHYEKGRYSYKANRYGINITGKPGVDFSYENTPYQPFIGKKPEDFLLNSDELQEYKQLLTLRKRKEINRFEYSAKMAKFKDKILKVEDSDKSFTGTPIKNHSNVFYYPNKCLLLTTTQDGFLIPFLTQYSYKGTSFSAPVRSAKIALNEAMTEILET